MLTFLFLMDSFILFSSSLGIMDKPLKSGTNIRIFTKKTKTPPPHVYVCQQTLGTFLCQTSASLDTFATALRTTNMHDKASTPYRVSVFG
jgi:hypothetical protein